jgi:hypothetical protein
MGIFDSLFGEDKSDPRQGAVPYGSQKQDGSHDHRYNKGEDRTPAQKQGDKNKNKSD